MAFNDDEALPPSNSTGNTRGLVTIKPVEYSRDDVSLKADAVTAVVELNATASTAVREGLDLVAVLDVSGSMGGEKMDSMKMAMQLVIMKLTPVDRLSIVTFSNSATRHCPLRSMTPAAQKDIIAIVNALAAGGGTNIKSGLDTGLAVVDGRLNKDARAANIFLLSDGQQTANDARLVDPGSVAVYTFGFGKDTDHQLLTDIAKKSPGGTFSTVRDGSSLTKPFAQLLGGLLTVVAQDVQLTLTPKNDYGDLDKMVVAPGTDYTQSTDSATGVITIKFGALFSGETRKVTVDLTLLDSTVSAEYDATLAEAQHSFIAQGRPRSRQTPQDVQILRTPKPTAYASSKARLVQAEIARRQHADSIGAARVLADDKKLDDAKSKLTEAQNALDGIRVDGGDKLVGMLRTELQQLSALMATQELYDAQGRAYALASETSHGRQRFGDRGDDSDDAVRLFATPRMDTYLNQAKEFDKDPTKPLPSAADDVKQEIAANPIAAISSELALYLQTAIQALQAIEKIVAPKST